MCNCLQFSCYVIGIIVVVWFVLGTSSERSVANALYNVYKYYSQFVPAVDNHIKDTTKPVEKDFKVIKYYFYYYWMVCLIISLIIVLG